MRRTGRMRRAAAVAGPWKGFVYSQSGLFWGWGCNKGEYIGKEPRGGQDRAPLQREEEIYIYIHIEKEREREVEQLGARGRPFEIGYNLAPRPSQYGRPTYGNTLLFMATLLIPQGEVWRNPHAAYFVYLHSPFRPRKQ